MSAVLCKADASCTDCQCQLRHREPALQIILDGRPLGVIVALRERLAGHVIYQVSFLITVIIRNGTFRVQVGGAHLH